MSIHLLVVIFFCICSQVYANSTLELYVSPSGNSTGCSIEGPCGSINDAFNEFLQTPNVTTLSINMFSGDYSGEGNTNLVIPSGLDSLSIQAQSQPVLINCDNYFLKSVSISLNVTSLTIQGCASFGIQTMNYDSRKMYISNVDMTNMENGSAFILGDGTYTFSNVSISNVSSGICSNFSSATTQLYIDGFKITNCDNGLELINYNTTFIQLSEILINDLSVTNSYKGIEIGYFGTAHLNNIQLNNVGNIDDNFFSLSGKVTSQNMFYGIKISNINNSYLEYISLIDCVSFELEDYTNIPEQFSLYGILIENTNYQSLKNVSLEFVLVISPDLILPECKTRIYAGICTIGLYELDFTNIHLKNTSIGNEKYQSYETTIHGIYSTSVQKITGEGLFLEYVGSLDFSGYTASAIYMNSTESITIETINFDNIYYNPRAIGYNEVYFISDTLKITNINMTNSNTIVLDANFSTITNGYFLNNVVPLYFEGKNHYLHNLQIESSSQWGIICFNTFTNITNSYFSNNRQDIDIIVVDSVYYIDNCTFTQDHQFNQFASGQIFGQSYVLLEISNSIFNNTKVEIDLYNGQTTLNNVQFYSSDLSCTYPTNSYVTTTSSVFFDDDSINSCPIYQGNAQIFYISPQTGSNGNCTFDNPCNSINQVILDNELSVDYFTFILLGGNFTFDKNIEFPKTTTILAFASENTFYCNEYCFKVASFNDLLIKAKSENLNYNILLNTDNEVTNSTGIIFNGNNLFVSYCQFSYLYTNIVFNGTNFDVEKSWFTNSSYGFVANDANNNCLSFSVASSYVYYIEVPVSFSTINSECNVDINGIHFYYVSNFYFNLQENSTGSFFQCDFTLYPNALNSFIVNIVNGVWIFTDIDVIGQNNHNFFSYSGSSIFNYLDISGPYEKNTDNFNHYLHFNSPGFIRMTDFNFSNTSKPIEIIQASDVAMASCYFQNCELPLNISSVFVDIEDLRYNNSGSTFFTTLGETANSLQSVVHDNSSGFVIQSNGNWSIEQVNMINTINRPWSVSSQNVNIPEFYFFDVKILQSNLSLISDFGGAIYADQVILNLDYVEVDGFVSSSYGGAVYSNQASIIVGYSSEFSFCSSESGGAIYCDNCVSFDCDGQFFMNSASNYGGSIFVQGGDVVFSNLANFTSCMSNFGGAAYLNDSKSVNLDGYYSNNIAGYYGGAIYADSNSPLAVSLQGTYESNQASNGAVLSCCSNSSTCPVSVEENNPTLNENVNSQGSDIACKTYVPPPSPISQNSSDYNDDKDTIPITSYILYGTIALVVLIVVILLIGAGYYFYRKKKRHLPDEYHPLINE